MYTLMKSERMVLAHRVCGPMVSYAQEEIERFQEFSTVIAACEAPNKRTDARHYILNGNGQGYYAGTDNPAIGCLFAVRAGASGAGDGRRSPRASV
jgi:hypothetical protein